MATTRKVRKNGRWRWRVSYRDALDQRHQRFFKTKTAADLHKADAIKQRQHKLEPRVDPRVTVAAYADQWLPEHAAAEELKPRRIESYAATLRLHVLRVPVGAKSFGDLQVSMIRRHLVKALIARQRAQGYRRDSVRITLAVLSAMFEAAVEDDLLVANPAHRLRKQLRLGASAEARTVTEG